MRLITLWRKPALDVLDWDFYITEPGENIDYVIGNIKAQGIVQFTTYQLGERVEGHSS